MKSWVPETGILVLNEQGTGYEYLKSIALKNGARHLKERPNISKFIKFERVLVKTQRHGTVFKIEKTRELSISSLILVYFRKAKVILQATRLLRDRERDPERNCPSLK